MRLILFGILGGLAAVTWIYWLVAYGFTRFMFFRKKPAPPAPDDRTLPTVAFLKPVKGLDAGLYDNLRSFCEQDYPRFEIIVGVLDADDPAIEVVTRLQRDFPETSIRLMVAKPVGCNPKSSILHHLAGQTDCEVLVASDSDVRVERDFARHIVAPLADERVGLVTCLYRCQSPQNLPATFESLYIETSFLPSAIIASQVPGVRYGFGAAMAYRKTVLEKVGGFTAIRDYLADDYQLAARIADLGMRTALCDQVVSIVLGRGEWKQLWLREVRWARTTRICVPAKYPGLMLTFATPWAIAALIVSGGSPLGWAALGGSLAVRWIVAFMIGRHLGLRGRVLRLLWLPIRDCLTAIIWAVGATGKTVVWRGRVHRFLADGRITRVDPAARSKTRNPLRWAVQRLDAALRHREQIFEFTDDPHCIFRMSVAPAESERKLQDGTIIRQGDPLIELHFWNEHLPPMPRHGANMAWAVGAGKQLARSLKDLAEYLGDHPELREIKAIHAVSSLIVRSSRQFERLADRLGFEMTPSPPPRGWMSKLHRWGENMLVLFLRWTFNPSGTLKLSSKRHEVWISKRHLMCRYGRRHLRQRASPPGAEELISKRLPLSELPAVKSTAPDFYDDPFDGDEMGRIPVPHPLDLSTSDRFVAKLNGDDDH